MNFLEEWKFCLPISLSSQPPFLIPDSSSKDKLGPLVFKPKPETLTHVMSFTDFMLPLAPCLPNLSFPKFLATCSVLPSTSTSVASLFYGEEHGEITCPHVLCNCLVTIKCPDRNNVVAFFPAGVNSEQVGFLVLYVEGSNWHVQLDDNGQVFKVGSGFHYSILRMAVNPIAHASFGSSTSTEASRSYTIGYLFASTMYSVHWFRIKINRCNSGSERPNLVDIGCKNFKSCSIVHACWSPHIPEESVVLLEKGELFFFDMESGCSNRHFKGKRLVVPWNDSINSSQKKWFSCEFSWHPRVLIVARSDVVFVVDFNLDEHCNVSYLAKVDMLQPYVSSKQDQFLAFSKAGCDGFYFALATAHLLLLCDVRKPMMPILQWFHDLEIERPWYMDVLSLSSLRSHTKDDKYKLASDSGFCILLGSFRNGEFNVFPYGPSLSTLPHKPNSEITCKTTLCSWDHPSEISLSGRGCQCGSCLLREEFSENDTTDKKVIVLGFAIIDPCVSSLLYEPHEFGGFTLLRLLSSGKLELQRYCASSSFESKSHECPPNNGTLFLHSVDYHFLDEYKFPRRFNYLKLLYLHAYLNGKLTQVVVSELEKPRQCPGKESFMSARVHEILCQKLSAYGAIGSKTKTSSVPPVCVALGDVSLPASMREVALRGHWADLPMEVLQLAFSDYSELLQVDKKSLALEYLAVTNLPQLPPFFLRKPTPRSNNRSKSVKPSEDKEIVGPLLPLPILHELKKTRNGGCNVSGSRLSVMAELNRKYCEEIMQVAGEISVFPGSAHHLSLASDPVDIKKLGSRKRKVPFLIYHPRAIGDPITNTIPQRNTTMRCKERTFDTLICHTPVKKPLSNRDTKSIEQEIDDICPIQLKFDVPVRKMGSQGLKDFKHLIRQISRWQKHFHLYQEFCAQSKLQN